MGETTRSTPSFTATDSRAEAPIAATIRVAPQSELGRIDRNIYGHFLESNFFGNIEGGVFDEGSPLAEGGSGVTAGLRRDVIAACRELGLPVVRWPGGNFASAYHWEDGVGPRDERPRRLDLTWGGEESNRFGTDEFLAWCAAVGTEPYLVPSLRSVDQAVRWLEYTNYGGDTALTRLRARNGHPAPYGVRYWGLGNEVYGQWQMGYRSAEQYAWDAAEHARFLRLVDPTIKLIAVGDVYDPEAWTPPLMARAGRQIDYVSLHLYGANRHLFSAAAGDDDYDATVAQSLYFEEQISAFADHVAHHAERAGVTRPLGLALDEWNMRHLEPSAWPEPQPGDNGGIAPRDLPTTADHARLRVSRYSPRTLADALFYAGVFHALQRLAGHQVPPTMANTVNLVNANGLLAVRPGGLVKQTTYYVWELFQNHTGPIALPVQVDGPSVWTAIRRSNHPDEAGAFASRPGAVPLLDVAATSSADRRSLMLTVINRHRSTPIRARLDLAAWGTELPPRAHARSLGADVAELQGTNSADNSEHIVTRDHGQVDLDDGTFTFAPHSVTLLTWTAA